LIPRFPSEAAEAEWWDAHRAEVEVDIRARLTNLAERTAADINGRADGMTPERRARADSETKKIAARVQRRTLMRAASISSLE
jgi:hypothetical protein